VKTVFNNEKLKEIKGLFWGIDTASIRLRAIVAPFINDELDVVAPAEASEFERKLLMWLKASAFMGVEDDTYGCMAADTHKELARRSKAGEGA
jgi:outer membrane scaffolding protein for murein synthesis (MipA/OmpV family)